MLNLQKKEISKQDISGLFFLDYFYLEGITNAPRWIRESSLDEVTLTQRLRRLDFSKIKRLRIQTMEELLEPVNLKGHTRKVCEMQNETFLSYCQKIEWEYGSIYKISWDDLEPNIT